MSDRGLFHTRDTVNEKPFSETIKRPLILIKEIVLTPLFEHDLARRSAGPVVLIALFEPEKGQGLVEYALILVLVAIVVIAALMILGPIIGGVFSKINSSLSGV